jgi:hypothetical protein
MKVIFAAFLFAAAPPPATHPDIGRAPMGHPDVRALPPCDPAPLIENICRYSGRMDVVDPRCPAGYVMMQKKVYPKCPTGPAPGPGAAPPKP